MTTLLLALAIFGACAVESTEALTLVLAASTRSVSDALKGAAWALGLLLVLGATLGESLVRYVPLRALHVALGGALLYLGATWLRKAVLRASGRKAKHDEVAIYGETLKVQRSAFRVAFGGVMIEGLEVLGIILTLGASSHHLGIATLAALSAVVVVSAVGVVLRAPLARVPENSLKLGVAVLLLSFGVFWLGEGAGVRWPGSDLMVLGLLTVFAGITFGSVKVLTPR